MSEDCAIRLVNVGKVYRLYGSITDRVLDVARLGWVRPWKKIRSHEFWALRNIHLEVKHGERVGIVGRNGSGKTTLLKLITGNFPPSEGEVFVDGTVQALMEAGAGFHPEFTGRQNAIASLEHMGLPDRNIEECLRDIAEFTELGPFIDQPFKSYSAGMKARLTFATATCIKPNLLIIDEVLGAGDGYFAFKSAERMQRLATADGATILLVSHDLQSVIRYCNHCIWIDRGMIVEAGPPIEIVKSYERYLRRLEEVRTLAKNSKRQKGSLPPEVAEGYGTCVQLRFATPEDAEPAKSLRIASVEGHYLEEVVKVAVGGVQDADPQHQAHVANVGSCWGPPEEAAGRCFRRCIPGAAGDGLSHLGLVLWNAPSVHSLDVRLEYSLGEDEPVELEARLIAGEVNVVIHRGPLAPTGGLFETAGFAWPLLAGRSREPAQDKAGDGDLTVSRWDGTGDVSIERIEFRNGDGRQLAVVEHGQPFTIRLCCRRTGDDAGQVIPAILIFSPEGIVATKLIGGAFEVPGACGTAFSLDAEMPGIRLQNGRFIVTAALYRRLDLNNVAPSEYYCVLDKSAEFSVVGVPVVASALFADDFKWTLADDKA